MKTADINVQYVDHMGTDLSVVNAARVSFDKESDWDIPEDCPPEMVIKRLFEKDGNLIKYLSSHNHISPFHHTFITLRVKAPIFVARQLVKHKFMPWNEVSRRYVDAEPEFYTPEHWRKKADNVKQGSSNEKVDDKAVEQALEWYYYDGSFLSVTECALKSYQNLLELNVCPEQARMVLPQNTMTEWIWSGTLSAWASMLRLRLSEYTQYETRLVAQKCRDIIQPLFPVSLPALLESNV